MQTDFWGDRRCGNCGVALLAWLRGRPCPRCRVPLHMRTSCAKCEYDISNLEFGHPCPECGTYFPRRFFYVAAHCVGCGYSLHGLGEHESCPECGRADPAGDRVCRVCESTLRDSPPAGSCPVCEARYLPNTVRYLPGLPSRVHLVWQLFAAPGEQALPQGNISPRAGDGTAPSRFVARLDHRGVCPGDIDVGRRGDPFGHI